MVDVVAEVVDVVAAIAAVVAVAVVFVDVILSYINHLYLILAPISSAHLSAMCVSGRVRSRQNERD